MRRDSALDARAIFLIVSMITVSKVLAFSPGDYKAGGKEFPLINPKPLSVFVVHGTIDPTLQIEFDAIYGVANKRCMYSPIGSFFEGAGTQAPSASIPLSMDIHAGQFKLTAAIDGVAPGRCRWVFEGIIARAINEDIFGNGISAKGEWVVSIGWQPTPGQPTPNPVIAKTCFIPRSTPDEAKYGVGHLSCGMTIPWGTVSEETKSVELNLSEGRWFNLRK